jgi:hypothetical protein
MWFTKFNLIHALFFTAAFLSLPFRTLRVTLGPMALMLQVQVGMLIQHTPMCIHFCDCSCATCICQGKEATDATQPSQNNSGNIQLTHQSSKSMHLAITTVEASSSKITYRSSQQQVAACSQAASSVQPNL